MKLTDKYLKKLIMEQFDEEYRFFDNDEMLRNLKDFQENKKDFRDPNDLLDNVVKQFQSWMGLGDYIDKLSSHHLESLGFVFETKTLKKLVKEAKKSLDFYNSFSKFIKTPDEFKDPLDSIYEENKKIVEDGFANIANGLKLIDDADDYHKKIDIAKKYLDNIKESVQDIISSYPKLDYTFDMKVMYSGVLDNISN